MKSNREAQRTARQLFRFCMADGVLSDERIRMVMAKLGEQKSRSTVVVLEALTSLVRIEKARRHAVVESAVEASPELRQGILADLKARYGNDVTAEFTITPALIGGLRVRLGSDVYDGSVRARLDRLSESLNR